MYKWILRPYALPVNIVYSDILKSLIASELLMTSSTPLNSAQNVEDYMLNKQVGYVLRRANQRHLTIFAAHIPALTPTQFGALAKLCELGRVSQNELGRQTAMDAATIKGVVDRLRKRDLVKTESDPDDQRRLYVRASKAGRALYFASIPAARQISEQTLSPLSKKEARQLMQLLEKLA